jgi:hypothetical protein
MSRAKKVLNMIEAGDEKATAKKMKAKGYKYIMISKKGKGDDIDPLYAKTPQMVADWGKEYKNNVFDTKKIDDFLAGK